MARKGKYDDWLTVEGLTRIEGWARDGLINEQIAHNMGISLSTLNEWRNKFETISAALKKGRDVADREVENALFKSAQGFYYEEAIMKPNEETGEMEEVQRVKKYQPPNTTAQIFWLKNRKPAEWRDKRDVEMSGELKNPVQVYLPDNGHGTIK